MSQDKLNKTIVQLFIPYDEKDNAKSIGARWNVQYKYWYCDSNNNDLIEKYKIKYIKVAYDKKDNAKSMGARWNVIKKCWYTYNSNPHY